MKKIKHCLNTRGGCENPPSKAHHPFCSETCRRLYSGNLHKLCKQCKSKIAEEGIIARIDDKEFIFCSKECYKKAVLESL